MRPPLSARLPAGTSSQRDAAAQALLAFAQEGGEACQQLVADQGAIPALAHLLRDGARGGESVLGVSRAGPAARDAEKQSGFFCHPKALIGPRSHPGLFAAGSSAARATASRALVALAANPALRKDADRARANPPECAVM